MKNENEKRTNRRTNKRRILLRAQRSLSLSFGLSVFWSFEAKGGGRREERGERLKRREGKEKKRS